MAIIEGEVTVTPVKLLEANVQVVKTTKPYELDWNKVTNVADVVELMKLVHGIDGPTHLYLYDSQVENYKHLFKDNA